jgi:hypothetical protein
MFPFELMCMLPHAHGVASTAAWSSAGWMSSLCVHATLQRVLLCGWGETQFMADLLAELDHGPSALPPGWVFVCVLECSKKQIYV